MDTSQNTTWPSLTPDPWIMTLKGQQAELTETRLTQEGLIGNDVKILLELIFQIVIFFLTSCLGVAANVINIRVYCKMGLEDSITLGFFFLSISDLLNVLSSLFISGCYIAKHAFPQSPVYFISVYYVIASQIRLMAFSFSCLITAFLSLERCCCVVLPLKVKLIFTRKRTAIFLGAALLFHIICIAPAYATHQLRWMKDPRRNNTPTLRVWLGPNRKPIETFNHITLSILTPSGAQFVLVCSAVVMVAGLIKATQFKRSATAMGKSAAILENSGKDTDNAGVLSNRDIRLVKAVVYLVLIMSACNVPYLAFVTALFLEPEFNLQKRYHNTYSLVSAITITMATINSSSNFLVYVKTSSRFREVLGQIIPSCDKRLSKLGD